MIRNYLLAILVLLMLFAVFFSTLSFGSPLSWNIQTVDAGETGFSCSIALDSNNNPHIAYGGTHDVKYASWKIQNISQGGGSIDLALDSNNNPHIVFNDIEGRLFYATSNSTGWEVQMLTSDGMSGSIALDSANNAQIAYLDTRNALKYAHRTATGWNIRTIDSSKIFNANLVSLALDTRNNPHILYSYDVRGSQNALTIVKYAAYNTSEWEIQSVISDSIWGLGNIALDSNGYPRFTYIIRSIGSQDHSIITKYDSTLVYASWNGSAWEIRTVISNVNWQNFAGYLALDSHDNPHITYYNMTADTGSNSLMYSTWTGTEWNTQTIESNRTMSAGPIALDSRGTPHIAYLGQIRPYGSFAGFLKHATIAEYAPNETSEPENALYLWGVLIIIVVVMMTIAYVWKKKATRVVILKSPAFKS
jgi:hypothetical protein